MAANPDLSRDSYQHELHRNAVSVVRFELTISCAQGRRIPRLSHTLLKAPSGSRTGHRRAERWSPTWRAGRLPLHHGCKRPDRIVKEQRRPEASGLRLEEEVEFLSNLEPQDSSLFSVGSERLELSPARVRTGCAAANTLIPCYLFSADRPGGSRTRAPPRRAVVAAVSERHASVTTPGRNRGGQNRTALSRAPDARGSPLPFTPPKRLET